MKILVLNSGSSSLKYQVIDMETEEMLAKGYFERIATPYSPPPVSIAFPNTENNPNSAAS